MNPQGPNNFKELVESTVDVINNIIPMILILSLIMLVISVIGYVFQSANSQKREEWRSYMLYAFIGFFIIASFWGIIRLALSIVQINPV